MSQGAPSLARDAKAEKEASAAKTGTEIVSRIGAAALGATVHPGAAIAGFLTIGPSLLGLSVQVYFDRKKRAADTWYATVVARLGQSPDEVRQSIEARIDEPCVHETVVESVRRLMDSVDEAVAPPLGGLTAEYLTARKRPDAFFRGLSRLLADLQADEYEGFRQLVAKLSVTGTPLRGATFTVIPDATDQLKAMEHAVFADFAAHPEAQSPQPDHDLGAIAHSGRLLRLMKAHDLAQQAVGISPGGQEAEAVEVTREVMLRISRLVN